MSALLDTGVKLVRNVDRFSIGSGSINSLEKVINHRKEQVTDSKCVGPHIIYLVDEFFRDKLSFIPVKAEDRVIYISTAEEPTTKSIDHLTQLILQNNLLLPAAIVGLGGGVTLDTTKAVSNLLTNGGSAADYQGWDLVKEPGVFKVGIPTISGTGAEATRTCVMTNVESGLKLGMNSDFTVFNQIILDPDLSRTVPREQFFYTGMDAYIHCAEALSGSYRNPIGDAYSREVLSLCRDVFSSKEMMSSANREKLMVASYLGGCAIATSYVGIVHPLSAALSVVLGLHHCVANCIVMRAMSEFYPDYYDDFWNMVKLQNILIPSGVCAELSETQITALCQSALMHEKPLTNALGPTFKEVLTHKKLKNLFLMM
ncbi:iron-containing alcohol dehydrogenase family protein [Polynucleobacter sp. AP-Ainpum-60-G11]|uniref:iron-containing alcohol dehydrogenase family protein n=1 Tax=Polynucleobacter sp. AP-Ainpum-60-G11 TaxID=2576926 RepID=UPI001BFDF945|nr:iron-containing alcohol dehydrogenase family protein [Polynucleobacter sp. AP-Ainpum-60-G11]QWE26999.1 iron-containing alcohol dehydrogenase [Polynucleobacter sp. AP-Ainpum-60-G11]